MTEVNSLETLLLDPGGAENAKVSDVLGGDPFF